MTEPDADARRCAAASPEAAVSGPLLGVDYGQARIGLARSDPAGLLATPLTTVAAGPQEADQVAAHATEIRASHVIVGLPLRLTGQEGPAAGKARDFAQRLARLVSVPVLLVDERNTTVEASRAMRAAGRSAKRQRQVIDQQAAVVILQHALDSARTTGVLPGRPIGLSSDEQREGPPPP